ncbi:MAG: hypothetical protein LBL99_04530 [Holosporaceae bacterium]|jgi:hypothetical protein|nr:hypothetical protein [Holosporaceae bacterium]
MKKIAFFILITACSSYETPDLPDLNKESFSTDEILQKEKELKEKIRLNKLNTSDANALSFAS